MKSYTAQEALCKINKNQWMTSDGFTLRNIGDKGQYFIHEIGSITIKTTLPFDIKTLLEYSNVWYDVEINSNIPIETLFNNFIDYINQ